MSDTPDTPQTQRPSWCEAHAKRLEQIGHDYATLELGLKETLNLIVQIRKSIEDVQQKNSDDWDAILGEIEQLKNLTAPIPKVLAKFSCNETSIKEVGDKVLILEQLLTTIRSNADGLHTVVDGVNANLEEFKIQLDSIEKELAALHTTKTLCSAEVQGRLKLMEDWIKEDAKPTLKQAYAYMKAVSIFAIVLATFVGVIDVFKKNTTHPVQTQSQTEELKALMATLNTLIATMNVNTNTPNVQPVP